MAVFDFVFFDLDDTLLDHRHAERAALAELHATLPGAGVVDLERFLGTFHDINVDVWKAYGAGAISRNEARSVRFERLFDRIGMTGIDPVAVGEEYLDRYSVHWRWLPGARDAWQTAAGSYGVGIITNGFAEIQRAKLSRFPDFERLASVLIVSEEVGMMKPDRRLFEHAAGLVGHRPHRILYVGDSLQSDVLGALSAGWKAAWFGGDPSAGPPGVLVFDDWAILLRMLGLGLQERF